MCISKKSCAEEDPGPYTRRGSKGLKDSRSPLPPIACRQGRPGLQRPDLLVPSAYTHGQACCFTFSPKPPYASGTRFLLGDNA